ncbi:hypothetical protein D3C71_2216740 [compost metagenome]
MHDRIAGSYVVTYLAYERLKAGEQTIGELETGGQDRSGREIGWVLLGLTGFLVLVALLRLISSRAG